MLTFGDFGPNSLTKTRGSTRTLLQQTFEPAVRGARLANSTQQEHGTVRTREPYTGMTMRKNIVQKKVSVPWAIFVQGFARPRLPAHSQTLYTLQKIPKCNQECSCLVVRGLSALGGRTYSTSPKSRNEAILGSKCMASRQKARANFISLVRAVSKSLSEGWRERAALASASAWLFPSLQNLRRGDMLSSSTD